MLEAYTDWTERARQFLAETGLVTLPEGETCAVVPSPVFQRPVLGVASYVAPPAFWDSLEGPLLRPVRARRRLGGGDPVAAVGQLLRLDPDDLGPRGVPGPPLAPRRCARRTRREVRRVYSTPYFSEGWALYAERVMRERGFFTNPLHELQHLNATLFRAARIIVDTSLHLGEMDVRGGGHVHDATRPRCPSPSPARRSGATAGGRPRRRRTSPGVSRSSTSGRRYLEARGFAGIAPADVPVEVLRDFHDAIAVVRVAAAGPRADRAVMASGRLTVDPSACR